MAKKTAPGTNVKYSKAAFLRSKDYINYRDILNALLKNERKYTVAEVNAILKKG